MDEDKKILWRFQEDTYYAYVGGLFLASRDEVQNAIGQRLFFSEAMGKHGDHEMILGEDNLTIVSEDPAVIAALCPFLPVGYDPLEHVTWYCENCDTFFDEEDDFDIEHRCCRECMKKKVRRTLSYF